MSRAVELDSSDWQGFARPGFKVAFRYPAVTPQGHAVERTEEPFRDNERVHLSSPDRQELYLEVVRFHDLSPQDEYLHHKPYLEQQQTLERLVFLLRVDRYTYRIIYDPRSALNTEIIATLTVAE